jgi:hypothetical protein
LAWKGGWECSGFTPLGQKNLDIEGLRELKRQSYFIVFAAASRLQPGAYSVI